MDVVSCQQMGSETEYGCGDGGVDFVVGCSERGVVVVVDDVVTESVHVGSHVLVSVKWMSNVVVFGDFCFYFCEKKKKKKRKTNEIENAMV